MVFVVFLPIQYLIKKYMESLTDEELKKESKQESKNEVISTIIRVSILIKAHSARGETISDYGTNGRVDSVSLQKERKARKKGH